MWSPTEWNSAINQSELLGLETEPRSWRDQEVVDAELNKALTDGWEPFAVIGVTVWFKRRFAEPVAEEPVDVVDQPTPKRTRRKAAQT